MLNTYQRQAETKLITAVVSLIIIAGLVFFTDHLKAASTSAAPGNSTSATTAPAASGTTTPSTPTAGSDSTSPGAGSSSSSAGTSSYKDGTYSAGSSYFVPHGEESIKVTVTLANGVVTDSSIVNSQGDPTSRRYQLDFTSAYKRYVVGQKISSLSLGIVAGASDTTQGFDDALSQIASQAQA